MANSFRQGTVAIVAPVPPPLGGMALQAQALRQNLESDGIQAIVIPTNPGLPFFLMRIGGLRTLLQAFAFVVRLFRIIPKVAVVHVMAASYFYFAARVVPAVLVARLFGRRVVINYRGGEGPRFFKTFGYVIRPLLRLADIITVPSHYLERCFAQLGLASKIVPNLVDLDRFKFHQRKNLSPTLLVTRNLEPMYNVLMALQAFEIVKRRYSDASIDVVGKGGDESRLKAWVMGKNLEGVFFHGAVDNQEMPQYLQRADILLNPTNVDNLPISLLEAFASGVPVVSTDVGGIPDLIDGAKAALLVQAGDYQQMAARVEELLANPDLVERLTISAHQLVQAYSWPKVRQGLLKAYFPGEEWASAVEAVEHE
jgi:glycosyltransferase involved in cell wall biosynthesis